MQLDFHPPLVIARSAGSVFDADLECLIHAHLWIRVDLTDWQVVRQGHLHVVRSVSDHLGWRAVDLSGHPVRLWSGEARAVPLDGVDRELADWMAHSPLSFYRIRSLAAVSDLGETIDDFRRRVLGGVGAEVRRRLDASVRPSRVRLPWRRPAKEDERSHRRRLATEVAGLASDIERLDVSDVAGTVVRAEAGVLLVDPEIRLPSPSRRDPMLG